MKVLVNSNPAVLWEEIIHEAEASCATVLEKDIENYVILMLMRFMDRPDIFKQIIADQVLNTAENGPHARVASLQNVGDTCLLFSGLFPGIAEKRLVKISYYVNVGRGAYVAISKANNDVYSHLAQKFVPIMDVLQSIRQYAQDFPDFLPFQAYELWNETGSKSALRALKKFTSGLPVHSPAKSDSILINVNK